MKTCKGESHLRTETGRRENKGGCQVYRNVRKWDYGVERDNGSVRGVKVLG